MKKLFNGKISPDIFYSAVLVVLTLMAALLNYFYFGGLIYDCGREFLVPSAINQGAVPIKDIFITYFPLSYQLNALIFRIFGASLDSLRVFGIIFLSLDVLLIYFLSRRFANEEKSFKIALIVSFTALFNGSIFNCVLGYSYGFIYALFPFLLALYLYLSGEKYVIPAFFSLGLCFALRAEYIFVLFPFLFFQRNSGAKKILSAFIAFFAPFALSFFLLFLQGFNFQDFRGYIIFLKNFLTTKSYLTYSANIFHTNFLDWIFFQLKSFTTFAGVFLLSGLVLAVSKRKIIYLLAFIPLFWWTVQRGHFCAAELFSWLCISLILLAALSKNRPFIFLSASVFLLAARFNFTYTTGYSAYIMPAALILFCVFFMETVKNEKLNRIFAGVMLLIAFANAAYFSISNALLLQYRLETEKGSISLDRGDYTSARGMVDAMAQMEGSVLILPEGSMLNFLTDKKTDLMLYQLLPNHIELLGEDWIISRLSNIPPENIVITNSDYSIYGTPRFCGDFGLKICAFIFENYNYKGTIGNEPDLTFKIFKLKN